MNTEKLVQAYLEAVKGNNHDTPDKATEIISSALSNGWSNKQVAHAISNKHPRASFLDQILYTKENLISNNDKLYHSELRILPPLPKSKIDEITGEIECVNLEEGWTLESVKVYTMYNLLMYYYRLFGIKANSQEVKRDIGIFKYFLNVYTIDQLLFIIDATYDFMRDKNLFPRNPFAVQDYTIEGLEVYEDKVAYDRAVGVLAGTS